MADYIMEAHVAYELLSRVHTEQLASELFVENVQKRPLLLKPTTGDTDSLADSRARRQRIRTQKQAQRRKSKKPRPLSAKQKRILGIHDIPKVEQKYDIYIPLWRMWTAYVREILGLQEGAYKCISPKSAGPLLASADLHGALLEVVRSRCVGRVGVRGIVVKDTKFTFELITRNDKLKVIPKEHTIFRFELPLEDPNSIKGVTEPPVAAPITIHQQSMPPKSLVFEMHGESFKNRAPDRATKKLKLHLPPDL